MAEKLSLPDLPASPMFIGDERIMTMEWQEFFRLLYKRVGGIDASTNTDISREIASETFSVKQNYNKEIQRLKKEIISEVFPIQQNYNKEIQRLKKEIVFEVFSKSYDKRLSLLEASIGYFFPSTPYININKLAGIENGAEVNEINGDGINGRVLRYSILTIADGTNPATLDCELVSLWNGDSDGPTDNVAKGATTGNYTLDGAGVVLKVEAAGLSGNCIMAIGVIGLNMSGVAGLTAYVTGLGNDIQIEAYNETGTAQDLTTLVDTGTIKVMILYLTST